MQNCLIETQPPTKAQMVDYNAHEAVDYFIDNLFYQDLREQDKSHVMALCKYVTLEQPGKMYNQINEAYQYFVEYDMIENLYGDKKYYVEKLITYYNEFNKY